MTTDALHLRDEPSLSAEILLVMPPTADLSYDPTIPATNGYLAVNYNGVDGFAHGSYLILFPATAFTTDWLNLRSGPSLDSPVVQVMPPDGHVQVKGQSDNVFFSVSYDQRVPGFAHGDYLRFENRGAFGDGDRLVVRTDALNMRTRGGLDYPVEAVLYDGTSVTVTGGPLLRDGYVWYRIDAGATGHGWVAGDYLSGVLQRRG
jgi:uncharacterized protein YgiM (DUF1202 family)